LNRSQSIVSGLKNISAANWLYDHGLYRKMVVEGQKAFRQGLEIRVNTDVRTPTTSLQAFPAAEMQEMLADWPWGMSGTTALIC
jgi:hypothetical protein